MSKLDPSLLNAIEDIFTATGKFSVVRKIDGTPHSKNINFRNSAGPDVLLQIDVSKIVLWVGATVVPKPAQTIEHSIRQYGFDRSGRAAASGSPGFHSGVKTFLGLGPHIEFFPRDLNEVASIVRAIT